MTVPLFAPRRVQTAPGPGETVSSPTKRTRGGGGRGGEGEGASAATAAPARHTYAREAAALVLLASALYTSLALASFRGDPLRPEVVGPDWVGPVGAAFAGFSASTVGVVAWALPLELVALSAPLLGGKPSRASVSRFGGDIVVIVILAALAHVAFPLSTSFGAMPLGGAVGELFGEVMRSLFSAIGSYIIGLTVVSLILVQRATFSFIELVQRMRKSLETAGEKGAFGLKALASAWQKAREIERASTKDEKAERAADAKIVATPAADAIIAALTAGDDDEVKKDATPDAMNVVIAKGASEPALPVAWNDGGVIASALVEADAPKPQQRKRRAPTAKPAAAGETESKENAAAAPVIVTNTAAAEAEAARSITPAASAAPAPAPLPITPAASAAPAAIAPAPIAPAPITPAAPAAPAPAVPAPAPITQAVKESTGPAIFVPPADPVAIMAVSDMAAGEAFFDAATPTPPAAPPKERAPKATTKPSRSIEPKAKPAPALPPPPTPTPEPAVVNEVDDEDEEDEAYDEDERDLEREAQVNEDEPEEAIDESPIAPVKVEPPKPIAKPVTPAPAVAPAAPAAPVAPQAITRAPEKPSAPEVVKVVPAVGKGFRLPTTDMLEPPSPGDKFAIDEEQLRESAALLEKTLADYGVSGKVEEIHPGPTVTTFEVAPAAGTKVSKVASLADDLALGLSRKVRIIAPIPGKNRIGFELPNERRMPVSLRELVEDRRFQEMKAPLPCVLGRDIIGAPYFADLASMPHVIVAGATGAGKSVGLNVMLVSLLFRKTPEELRMLMIDPKVVELAPFDRIPHMLLPVVTDMKQAANALKWAVDEMERRYQLFANAGTKNIGTYNAWVEKVARGEAKPPRPPKKVAAISAEGLEVEVDAAKDGTDVALPEKIPYIVIVVDEFADLMMQQGKDVEASVARLAQKARAAGMHVILATQRPSVDVITGMIKANFPTRIAFRVAQKVDSRTILDEQGAEHLLGRGDMLVKMNGATDTRRVQCPFASEEEVQRITDFLRLQGEPVYDEAILKPRDEEGQEADTNDAENDPMYDAAVRIVAETRRCSTSWIQRKLGVGYNRAAKIVEAMEKRGIVGPANGAKDREVLIAPL
ncbi:DNA translocase FtsK 4TM domain-containing protein [Polyangium sp. y55x31]|uniref:FtsK/SpoIIIE family DNA translocase n=1 Tax=Polyangium sp. y55x31 TaxID=3042688 RepID=UPI0024823447|nr:DNA translocase FtsK 4TM domain-containing protein [Polyangium sp. y55x31]MDI1484773.1 DNA translocase FtsK 4TM domain-containing protein [Polyangium sp. y55x31]